MSVTTIIGGSAGCHGTARITPFQLERPTSISEAVTALDQGATVMAGGIDLIDRMKAGMRIDRLVVLGGIAAMRRIIHDGDRLRIGAAVTHQEIATDPTIRLVFPDLAAIWRQIGNIRIRLRGSLGGNIMAGMPAYEAATYLAACGATARFRDADGSVRVVPVAEAVDQAGLLTHIDIRNPRQIRLRADRSLRDYGTFARADHKDGRIVVAVGGFDRRPAVAAGHRATVPPIGGPHRAYLAGMLPALIERLGDD